MNANKDECGVCYGGIRVDEKNRQIHLPTLHTKVHFSDAFRRLRYTTVGGRFFKICDNFLDWVVGTSALSLPPVTLGSRSLDYIQIHKDVLDTIFIRGGKYPLVFPDDVLAIITNADLIPFIFRYSRKVCFFLMDRYGKECRIMVGCEQCSITLEAFDVNHINHRINHHNIVPLGTFVIGAKGS